MIKRLLIVLLSGVLAFPAVEAAPGDTTLITAHQAVDMTWYGNYDEMVFFPTGTTYGKVVMEYEMGCASGGCSDWDYTTQIQLQVPTGVLDSNVASIDTIGGVVDTTWNVFEIYDSYELGRAITPYGGYMASGQQGYNNNWSHRFYYDVTDYQSLMNDSVRIRAHYSGWSSGFSATVKFHMIEGTPPRNVLSVTSLINRSFGYQNQTAVDSLYLTPQDVVMDPNMQGAAMRVITSGHGFDNNVNCAEFCERDYFVYVDGTQQVAQSMWRNDCGLNPIYPQGGTWLYDRANWCPGTKATGYWHELTPHVSAGQTHEVDLSIQNYGWNGAQTPSYTFSAVLFQYGAHNRTLDAAIEDIHSPSKHEEYRRMNPVCGTAIIELKNYGSAPLTSVTFNYAQDVAVGTHQWTGNLAYGESELVELDLNFQGTLIPNGFFVEIVDVNGQGTDGISWNDRQERSFDLVDDLPRDTYLELRTNLKGFQTSWSITDQGGTVLYSGDNLSSNTLYRDTFELAPGCYHFRLNDSGKNGLSWWADNDGSGYCRIRGIDGSIMKVFKPDFGTRHDYEFTVTSGFSVPEEQSMWLQVYPNPTAGVFWVDYALPRADDVFLTITDLRGRVVAEKTVEPRLEYRWEVDLTHQPAGLYLLQVRSGQEVRTEKIVVQ